MKASIDGLKIARSSLVVLCCGVLPSTTGISQAALVDHKSINGGRASGTICVLRSTGFI